MHTRLDFDFSACKQLRVVHITFTFRCIFCYAVGQGRQSLWELSVGALSRIPAGGLTDIHFELRLVPSPSLRSSEQSTASQNISALCDLRWHLLEGVLDRQPQLKSIDVRLVYDGPRLSSSQMALIEAKLSPRLRHTVRFCSDYEDFPLMTSVT